MRLTGRGDLTASVQEVGIQVAMAQDSNTEMALAPRPAFFCHVAPFRDTAACKRGGISLQQTLTVEPAGSLLRQPRIPSRLLPGEDSSLSALWPNGPLSGKPTQGGVGPVSAVKRRLRVAAKGGQVALMALRYAATFGVFPVLGALAKLAGLLGAYTSSGGTRLVLRVGGALSLPIPGVRFLVSFKNKCVPHCSLDLPLLQKGKRASTGKRFTYSADERLRHGVPQLVCFSCRSRRFCEEPCLLLSPLCLAWRQPGWHCGPQLQERGALCGSGAACCLSTSGTELSVQEETVHSAAPSGIRCLSHQVKEHHHEEDGPWDGRQMSRRIGSTVVLASYHTRQAAPSEIPEPWLPHADTH